MLYIIELEEEEKRLHEKYSRKNEHLKLDKMNLENEQNNFEALKKLQLDGMYTSMSIQSLLCTYLFPH